MVLGNRKFRRMEILIMNSAGEFISAILFFILLSMTEREKKGHIAPESFRQGRFGLGCVST